MRQQPNKVQAARVYQALSESARLLVDTPNAVRMPLEQYRSLLMVAHQINSIRQNHYWNMLESGCNDLKPSIRYEIMK